MTGLVSAWIAEMVLIAYRGAKTGTTANNPIPHLALPSEYASTFIIFGALAFIPGEGQKVATAAGWGLVLATFLNLWNPGGTVKANPNAIGGGGSSTDTANATAVATSAGPPCTVTVNPNSGTARVPGLPATAQ